MEVRRFTKDDYAEISRWWTEQGRSVLPLSALPTLGFIAFDGTENLAVAWLYISDSAAGFVGFTTTNPVSNRRKIAKALRLIDLSLQASAKRIGLQLMFRFSGGGGFSRLLAKLGWKDTLVKHDFFLREV